ncbi:DUF2291 domain-containing protein [Pedobacter alpinus]|uniref:DUF2291 domain-containing protein n=1 Tax=Pedobacter alpinus TaxID=1590643 RepID=A0ABW5TRE3_9SPHI
MRKKIGKYIAAIVLCVFIGYNSVYFKSLSKYKEESAGKTFDAVAYAKTYLNKELLPSIGKYPNVDTLLMQLISNPKEAFKAHSHALSIGNIRFFMVKGTGEITSVKDHEVILKTSDNKNLRIATEFVFGNALRDASGEIKVEDFTNSMDLNNVSAEVNKLVRKEVLPSFKGKVKVGDKVAFAGAFEINQEYINLKDIEIIPVKLTIQ